MAIKKYIGPNRLSEIFSYIKAELDKKVTAVSGKGLSSNDYTTTEKNKLAGISSGAEVNVQSDWDESNTGSDAYILHKPTSMPASDVPSWAKQPNKPSYTFSEITSKPTTIAGYGITDAKIANGTITLGSNSITPVTDVSGKADKATTLAGYGITDAKIANGTITLGSNTITPLTQHQDISGKADKATTLAGYGITDAKIANGTITLGSNTITPLTSHQTVSNKGATLAWSSAVTVATIGSTDIKVSLPANPNTDTKVTSVGNHYAPAEDSTAQLDADASSSTAATWNSTSLVTGVTVKRDAKGHVTGLAVDSIKMPANPNTNTTYTFADGTNGFTVTPSGGTAQTVKVTPSITNNVTGSGTSGYLAKFNGANTITNGPQLGSGTTTYLRNDGSWATPTDTNTTYTIATGDSNGQIKVTPSSGSAYNVSVKGLGSSAYTTEDSISPYEANLRWGGKNFTGSYGPIDAALMDELGANRFQFIKASAITVEYSRDGGSTWTDYGATDAQKQQIFAQGGGLSIGKNDSSNKATANGGKYKLRITIDTGVANVYSWLNKFVIYCSTGGSAGCYCQIQIALQSTPTTFIDHTSNISISGWSGYNVLNTSGFTTYGNSPTGQYGRVRFIFGDGTGGNTNYNGLNILQIKAFGGVGWSTPSTMAKSRHLYSYDENQNATFPANLYMSAGTIITPKDDSKGIRPNTNNYGEVGDASYYFYKSYCTNYYGTTSYVTNWSRNNNIGTPSTSNAASGTGLVNFYNTCAAGGTQTKTTLSVDTSVNSNITVYLPKASGNLALAATTLAGYGITDAKIANGVITLGSNTITPLTSITSSQVTTALGYTPYNSTNPNGYITSSGSCASATKATQDGSGNVITSTYSTKSETTIYKGNLTSLGSGTPAAATQTYWESNSNIPINTVNTAYNTSGDEYTLILSKGGSANYGSILKYGYSSRYLYILRRYSGNWQSTDWEKMYAGYADSAGSVAWSNVSSKPTTISGYGITDAKIANGTITLGSNTITPLTSITSSQVTTALGYTPYNSSNPNGYITSSGSCASATKATQDSDGNTISSTYMKKGVDRVTAGKKSGTDLGVNATAEGSNTTASGRYSHAEGLSTVASEYYAHAEGYETTASGDGSHAEGRSHETFPTIVTKATGMGSHAEGIGTLASGLASHAEGYADYSSSGSTLSSWKPTTASGEGSHAEGVGTVASATASHAEGLRTTAAGQRSHAEGWYSTTTSTGVAAHAEGEDTEASELAAHAEGYSTVASGYYSHAEGNNTIAASQAQHVEGKYNVEDADGTYAHIIGGGSSSARKNIFTVDWNGDVCAGRSNGLTNSTKLPTGADVLSYGFIRIGVMVTSVSYSSNRYADINVTQLTGKNILGILNVNVFGSRDNASYGIVNATPSTYIISVSIYTLSSGGTIPASASYHNIQIWYYY